MTDIHKLSPADSVPALAEQADPSRHDAIARRAHELWRQQGEPGGRDLDIWLEAERLTIADADQRSGPAAAPAISAPVEAPETPPAGPTSRKPRRAAGRG